MKSLKSTLALLIISGSLFVSCKKETTETKVENDTASKEIAKSESTSFNIEGMTCAVGCAKTIENKLANLEGVKKATVDFDNKTATIQYDAAIQTPEKIVETVEAVADGKTYKVSNVKSSSDKAMLYQEKQDQEKSKKNKKNKKSADEASSNNATVKSDVKEEKKGGCCAGKKSCPSEKPTTM
jgi:periplasmic mercuric ion binding protein